MKKNLSLAEVRKFFDEENCFETETCFLVNRFGQYRPNITFVIPKVFDLGKDGKPINPLEYVTDSEVTDNMNLDFDGSASFIYGDFWRSKKGGACFRPKDPTQSKHLLIYVSWGGCFNSHRGNRPDDVKEIDDVLYFRRTSSNGGGAGCDYWVLPADYTRHCYDEEIDGNHRGSNQATNERARACAKKHSDLQKKAVSEADTYLKEKAAAEAASKANREKFLPRLTEIQAELAELGEPKKFGNYGVGQIEFVSEEYFSLGYTKYLYNEESLAKAEDYLVHNREWVTKEEASRQAKHDAHEAYVPLFENLRSKVESVGWELTMDEKCVKVVKSAELSTRYSDVREFTYTAEGVSSLRKSVEDEADRIAEEEWLARNAERINNLLRETDLPEELWFLFERSEDLDAVILGEVRAILAAHEAEKDNLDMHELCYCGFDRRCNAIKRVLENNGGGVAQLRYNSQSASKALAGFLAG